MIEKKMLKCQIRKGMFSSERVVKVALQGGSLTSVFVPSGAVEGDIGTDGSVKVGVFNDKDGTWAVLPTEYQDIVPINQIDLVSI